MPRLPRFRLGPPEPQDMRGKCHGQHEGQHPETAGDCAGALLFPALTTPLSRRRRPFDKLRAGPPPSSQTIKRRMMPAGRAPCRPAPYTDVGPDLNKAALPGAILPRERNAFAFRPAREGGPLRGKAAPRGTNDGGAKRMDLRVRSRFHRRRCACAVPGCPGTQGTRTSARVA